MKPVTIYTRDWCGFCAAALTLLKKKEVAYEEINATGDAGLRAEMIERSGGGSTYPQIFIGDAHIGGCDQLYDLDASGELDRLLGLA